MKAVFHDRISGIGQAVWDDIAAQAGAGGEPLISYAFLNVLEESGSVGGDSGWHPSHLQLMDGDETLAVMPLYIKEHSWGEYVFDWSWAQAVEQAGGQYYPKLVTASPMTPCVGPRLLWAREQKPEVMVAQALKAVQERAEQIDASSWHLLFPMPSEARLFELAGCSLRTGVQFHCLTPTGRILAT